MKIRALFNPIFFASEGIILGIILSIMMSLGVNISYAKDNCTLEISPKDNEIAFAPTGSKLLNAQSICQDEYLEIPHDQKIGAISLLKGDYPRISANKKDITFKAINNEGNRVQSCLWCDRIDRLMVNDNNALCSISFLNVRSCATPDEAVFSVQRKNINMGEVCVPTLAYFGRHGSELRFAVQDCKNKSSPAVSYDLSFGNVIRFLDERIEIIRADNNGIHYRRTHINDPELAFEN